MGDECLMNCVGYQGSDDLSTVRIGRPESSSLTYDSLGAETVLFAVLLKIIEDLGTRYCAAGS